MQKIVIWELQFMEIVDNIKQISQVGIKNMAEIVNLQKYFNKHEKRLTPGNN